MGLLDAYSKPAPVSSSSIKVGSYQINKARADVAAVLKKLEKRETERDLLLEQVRDAAARQLSAQRQLDDFDKITMLLQKTSQYARGQVKGKIENTVSQALNVVYGGNHRYIIDLVTRAGRPECDYYLLEGGVRKKLEKPDYNEGGGKIDVISLCQKLALAEIEGVTGPILLDEVGKHVDGEAAVNLAYFLKEYAVKFNRQLILITHNTALETIGDVNIRVTRNSAMEAEVRVV